MSLTYIPSISIFYLKQEGYIVGREVHQGKIAWADGTLLYFKVDMDDRSILFSYPLSPDSSKLEDFKQCKVSLYGTECNFGWIRFWFRCPSCLQRRGVLYILKVREHILVCGRCTGYDYASRRSSFGGVLALRKRQLQWEVRARHMRTKYYRGRPTRRYRRFLEVMGSLTTEAYFKKGGIA